MQNTAFARATTPEELRHARYLDALFAFRPATCLTMTQGAPEGGTGGDGGGSGTPTPPPGGGAGAPAGPEMATDDQGKSLGFPKDTRVVEMTDAQAAAYWKHNAQKHEGRYKSLTGDRSFDDAKAALEAAERLQREQQTPAEQALNDKFTEGKKAGATDAYSKAATAIFRGALEAAEISADDVDELVTNFNVAGYITDDGVDASKIAAFAKRFTPGTGTGGTPPPRRRDFGGGTRTEGEQVRGAAGKAEAERRFKQRQQQSQ